MNIESTEERQFTSLSPALSPQRFVGQVESVDHRTVGGWILDLHIPMRSAFVTLFHGRVPVYVARPIIWRHELVDSFGFPRSLGFVIPRPSGSPTVSVVAPDRTPLGLGPDCIGAEHHLRPPEPDLPCPTIFLHIQNSMGTSIRDAVMRKMHPPDVLFVYPFSVGIPNNELYDLPALMLASAKLIFGHAYFGIHEGLPIQGRYRTILRCPIERLIANVFRLMPPGTEAEQARDFFMAHPIDEFDNYQTRVISGFAGPFGSMHDMQFRIALDHVNHLFDRIGFFDTFDTVLAALSEFIDPGSLKEERRSSYSRDRALSVFTSGEVRERLLRAVALDVRLYCRIARERNVPIRNTELYTNLGLI